MEGSERVVKEQLAHQDEVEHEYESQESQKLEPAKEETHKIGKDEINILDEAVMNSFKKHLAEVEKGKMDAQAKREAAQKEQEA
jgi:hypothetical protein